jgi:hypothetical protein
MTTKRAWSVRVGFGAGVMALGLAGCDVDVIDYPEDGTGGMPASGGDSSIGSGGTGTGGGAVTSSGGLVGVDGLGGLGGAGAEFPWPDLPSDRGTVVGIEPWDPSTTGCCTRVAGEGIQSTEYCPVGVQTRQIQTATNMPNGAQTLQFNFVPQPTPVLAIAVVGSFAAGTEVGVMLTDVPPPENIVDYSPVLWVGTESGELPAGAMVSLTPYNYGGLVAEGMDGSVSVYYSEDGVEFAKLEKLGNFEALGATALIEKPGFIVAGMGPGIIECTEPE